MLNLLYQVKEKANLDYYGNDLGARPGSLSASTVAFPSFFPALIGESFFTVLVAEEILLNVVTIEC